MTRDLHFSRLEIASELIGADRLCQWTLMVEALSLVDSCQAISSFPVNVRAVLCSVKR